MSDVYPWDDGFERECDHCGKVRICQYLDDPFIAELYADDYDEDVPIPASWWCGTCHSDRKADV